jgi:hypothetical protein
MASRRVAPADDAGFSSHPSGADQYYPKSAAAAGDEDDLDGILQAVEADMSTWDGTSDVAPPAAPVSPPASTVQPAQPQDSPAADVPIGSFTGAPLKSQDDQDDEDDEPLLSAQVEHTIGEMKKGLERTKRKLDKSRAKEAELSSQLERTKNQLTELRQDRERLRRDAEEAAARAKAARMEAEQKSAAQRKRANLRRRMLPDDDDALEDGELAVDADFDDDAVKDVEDSILRLLLHKLHGGWKLVTQRIGRVIDRIWLRDEVEYIEARFGSSVSVYFYYSEMICNLAVGNILIWLCVQIMSIVQHAEGAQPDVTERLTEPWKFMPPSQLKFSAYGAEPFGEWKRLSIAYGITVVVYMLWYVLRTMRRVVKERHRMMYLDIFAHNKGLQYARQVLTSWDVSMHDEASLKEQQHAALQGLRMLRSETQWRDRVKSRPPKERAQLRLRRASVVSLHGALQGGVWFAIVFVQMNSKWIDENTVSFASVLLYTVLVEVMPTICPALAKACKWDNPKSTRQHVLAGLYFGRVIALVFLGISELGMLMDWADDTSGVAFGGIGRPPARTDYECGQDQLAFKFLQQAIIGFAVPKVTEWSIALAKWVLAKVRKKTWTRGPFNMEKKFIRNVYFQGLLWISIPYFPMMAFLMPLLLLIEFKLDKAFLIRLCNKTSSPFQGDLSQLLIFHTATMFIFVAAWVYVFVQQYFAVDLCGPFWDPTLGSLAQNLSVTDYIGGQVNSAKGSFGQVVDVLFDYVISNSYLLWLVLLALFYAYVDRGHRILVLQEYVEERKHAELAGKQQLQQKAVRLERQVDKLKLQLKHQQTAVDVE